MPAEMETMLARAAMFIIAAALPPTMSSASAAAPAISWPQGWELRDIATPTTESGERFDGSNKLAFKTSPEGKVLAAINVTALAIRPGDKPDLDHQMASLVGTVQKGYTAKGMSVSCQPPERTTLGGRSALQTDCHVHNGHAEIIAQRIVVAIGSHDVESISYTAPPANFSTYEADFTLVRQSLRID